MVSRLQFSPFHSGFLVALAKTKQVNRVVPDFNEVESDNCKKAEVLHALSDNLRMVKHPECYVSNEILEDILIG